MLNQITADGHYNCSLAFTAYDDYNIRIEVITESPPAMFSGSRYEFTGEDRQQLQPFDLMADEKAEVL